MTQLLFSNNATTTLAGAINNVATSISLAPGAGVLFPAPGAGQAFTATLTDAATGLINEILSVTNVTGDIATVVRGQEGTSAVAWNAGDNFSLLATAGVMASFSQIPQTQTQPGNYAVATGTNVYAITLSPVPTYASLIGAPIRVKFTNGQTTQAMTLNVNGLGAKAIIRAGVGTSQPQTFFNDILPGTTYELVYDGVSFILIGTASAAVLGSGVARAITVPNDGSNNTIFAAVQGVAVIYSDQGGGNAFSDLVTFYQGGSVAVLSSSIGSPSARSYTTSGSLLRLALSGGPGSAPITTIVLQSVFPTP